MIQDPRGGLAVKCKKMPYLTIFNKLKHFTMPTFWVILKTLNTPLALFWDSIVNLCTV